MKQLRLSTLSLCCLTAIMSPSVFAEDIKPLLQEGKTTLYQRVLSTPSCELLEKSDAKSGQKIPAFSRYYVYKRENVGNKALLQVGPDSFGKTVGWLDANCAVPWNMQMTMVFTNPSDRGSLLFFKDKATLESIINDNSPAKAVESIRAELSQKKSSEKVLAEEPKEFVDFQKNFYLLPVLQGEEVMDSQGFYERLLEVASVSKNDKPVTQPTTSTTNNNQTNKTGQNQPQEIVGFSAAVVFVIDSTISMDPYINRTRDAIKKVYEKIEKENLGKQVKFGLVAFRSSTKAVPGLEYTSKMFVDPSTVKDGKDFMDKVANLKQATVSSKEFSEDLKTPSGKNNHQIAQAQYNELSFNNYLNKPLYYPVNAGDVNEFGQKVDTLASALTKQVKQAYSGEEAAGSVLTATTKTGGDPKKSEIEEDAVLLGKAMQLAYLGDVKGTKAPPVFKAWVSDRDFAKPTVPTAEARVLLTKSQLSDLSDVVKKIADAANSGLISPTDMFAQLRSVAAAMGQDPNKIKEDKSTKLADLGLLGEYLDGIPYKSQVTGIDEDTWKGMSVQEQEKFIRDLHSKLRHYRIFNEDQSRWIPLSEGADPRDNVYPVPLDALP